MVWKERESMFGTYVLKGDGEAWVEGRLKRKKSRMDCGSMFRKPWCFCKARCLASCGMLGRVPWFWSLVLAARGYGAPGRAYFITTQALCWVWPPASGCINVNHQLAAQFEDATHANRAESGLLCGMMFPPKGLEVGRVG